MDEESGLTDGGESDVLLGDSAKKQMRTSHYQVRQVY